MDFALIKVKIVGSEFVVFLLTITVNQIAVVVNVLVNLLQGGILAVVLVVVILKGHDRVLIHEHNILCLGQGVRQHRCGPFLVSHKLRLKIDTFVSVVRDVIRFRNYDAIIIRSRCSRHHWLALIR